MARKAAAISETAGDIRGSRVENPVGGTALAISLSGPE